MSRLLLHPTGELILRARVAVLAAMTGAVGSLLAAGIAPLAAVAIALAATAGGVEVARALTGPYRAPPVRVTVLVVIIVLIVNMVRLGYPALMCVTLVPAGAWCAAALARRATGAAGRQTPAA